MVVPLTRMLPGSHSSLSPKFWRIMINDFNFCLKLPSFVSEMSVIPIGERIAFHVIPDEYTKCVGCGVIMRVGFLFENVNSEYNEIGIRNFKNFSISMQQ